MFEYSCFFHPQEKGDALEDRCGICGHSFGFPLEHPPTVINGKPVERPLGRGFYGAVFLTRHPRTRIPYAVKMIPGTTYAPRDRGGYEKDFRGEAQLHLGLVGTGLVPGVSDYSEGLEDFAFGDKTIACYWLEMDYVEGPTLEDRLAASPDDPREVAQIAWDLLDFVDAMQQRGRFHNDLHGRNIKIVYVVPAEARRQAIHPRIRVKVLDLGSVSDRTKSNTERLGDIHWVAQHILNLLDVFERSRTLIDPATIRLCSQLRRVAEYYCARDRTRAPKPEEMKAAIHAAYSFGERPWNQPVRLASVSEHYNAQTLPPWFAPELLYDPGGRWVRRMIGPGPQLLIGMRGCGKTVLLRSLEWVARAHQGRNEKEHNVRERVRKDAFLGLFVSCAALLRTPRAEVLDLPLHRLFLAFAREVIRDVQACEFMNLGTIDYSSLATFSELVGRVCSWFETPVNNLDLVALERSLSSALHSPPSSHHGIADVTPRLVFDELAMTSRRLVDLWSNKKLLFLLDDVSTRYLTAENVQGLLSQLCLQSPEFGFKISTETQTMQLRTPGGEAARVGRDYEIFDLGAAVMARLGGARGTDFIGEVLARRVAVTDAVRNLPAEEILGRQSLVRIAEVIRVRWQERKGAGRSGRTNEGRRLRDKAPVYWGLDMLAGVCVGDIGDVLQLYTGILDRAGVFDHPINRETQDEVLIDFAEQKLFSLAGQDEWLYSHAVAFAEAAHRELKKSAPPRLRQYNEIFVKIDPSAANRLFPKIVKLIDAGVFLFTGGTPRTKSRGSAPFLQFKLAYRKALGLTNRIPLSMRDRFELSGKALAEWLEEPSSGKLQPRGRRRQVKQEVAEREPSDRGLSGIVGGATAQPSLFGQAQASVASAGHQYPEPHVLHTIKTVEDGRIEDSVVEWESKHIIAAFGFESRSLGAWRNLLPGARPGGVTMLQYPDIGLTAQIREVLNAAGVQFNVVPTEAVLETEEAERLVDACGERAVVIDTTSLTKALIYSLVRQALVTKREVWVLHTEAREYHPTDAGLQPVVQLFQSGRFPEAFKALERQVTGEAGPYRCVPVGPQHRDPSQPSLPATFVALKKERVTQLLEEVPVEAIAAVAPVHSSGPHSGPSLVARYIAQFLVQRYGGTVHEVGSLDHKGAYQLLVELHRAYALNGGYNFEITLTGSKMHAVAAGMFAATATPSSVYYSKPKRFYPERFSKGAATTRLVRLVLSEGERKDP